MAELIDLTLTLGSERATPGPGLLGMTMEPIHTHETDARSNTKLTLGIHLGTHVDAPYHFHPNGSTIEDMPLDKYMGPAVLLDLRGVARSQNPVSVADLQLAAEAPDSLKNKIAVLFTAWTERESGGPRFYSHAPYLSIEAAEYLVGSEVKAVATDFPLDQPPATPQSTMKDFPVTRLLLGQKHSPYPGLNQSGQVGGA